MIVNAHSDKYRAVLEAQFWVLLGSLMKFDDQNGQSGIEALAGATRLKAGLQGAITGFDCQISLGYVGAYW